MKAELVISVYFFTHNISRKKVIQSSVAHGVTSHDGGGLGVDYHLSRQSLHKEINKFNRLPAYVKAQRSEDVSTKLSQESRWFMRRTLFVRGVFSRH